MTGGASARGMSVKKEYKKRKNENLAQWVDRLAPACQGRSLTEVHEMLTELSKTSYIEGCHVVDDLNKKFGR